MAALGSGSLADAPSVLSGGTYTPWPGSPIGAGSVVDFSGGGSSPVDPKRYLNVGGTAVPIQ